MAARLRYDGPVDCDVAIVGAELAGLITGAILAKRGLDVVVIDKPPQIAGGGGSTLYDGYWLDGGHRDGLDVTDLEVGWRWGAVAAREAGVEVPLRQLDAPLLVHLLPEFPPREAAPVVPGDFSARGFAKLASDVFGVSDAAMPEFGKVLARLADASPEERRASIPVTLEQWLADADVSAEVANSVYTMAKTIFCEYPERASAGRLMNFFGARDAEAMESGFGDDVEVGGMAGLSAPFARAFEAHGGRLWLDHEAIEVLFEGESGRASGVVALSPAQLVLELRARAVVLARPLWDALPLLPPERVDAETAEVSRRLLDESGDGLALQVALSRIPRVRATGEVDSFRGWNRFFVGEERTYKGGFHIPSLSSRASAPDGRHLLNAMIVRWLRDAERPRWNETRETLDGVRATLRTYYLDFDECVIWEAYQWVQRPAAMAWFWAPVERHGPTLPGCPGLWLATSTFESDAGPVDICAHAGVVVAREVAAALGVDA